MSKKMAVCCVGLAIASGIGACAEDAEKQTPESEQISLGLEQADSVSVELLADGPLHVGLNQVYYRVKRVSDGAVVESATIDHTPMMNMVSMGMEHSSPHDQPPGVAVDGLFPAFVVFQMPSGDMGSWRVETVVDAGGGDEAVTFEVTVADSGSRKDLAMGEMGTAIVTLDFDRALQVGQNPFTVTVNRKTDMHGMMWEPLTDLTVTAVPDMPSMGHGSPGNIDPTHVEGGRYDGSVNLTMPGQWRIVLGFARGDEELGTVEYSISL
jgi:hypothetical protein